MKLSLEVEVNDDFIKLLSKRLDMTEEETVNFIKEYLEKLIFRSQKFYKWKTNMYFLWKLGRFQNG